MTEGSVAVAELIEHSMSSLNDVKSERWNLPNGR
jgi:hypothetical protein